jgi:CheY-like chemotaxis protein
MIKNLMANQNPDLKKPLAYKILLVEDAKVAQEMARQILSDLNCEVDIANTGIDGINDMKQNVYDMILMDLGLPDMDGFSVVEHIREIERKKCLSQNIPIIALTIHEGEHIEITCLDHAMNGILIKPLTEEKAKHILKKYLK